MRKYILLLLLFIPNIVDAKELTNKCNILVNNEEYKQITDGDFTTKVTFDKDEQISISCEEDAYFVYINYDNKYTPGTLETSKTYPLGENKFLHELVKIEPSDKMTLKYDDQYTISDIYVFDNELPSWVQEWERLDEADLMLFSTHSDDEQLFFAGLLPTYADQGKKIMVVYYTNHYNNINRYHELLNGLWTLGIKYYPEVSTFPDEYSETLEAALEDLNDAGYTEEDAINFQVDMIRKYKPRVVVGHDEKGEYSHGQHILNTYTLEKAIFKAADKDYKTKNNYDAYQIDKLYLHLYKEKPIVMNYDTPLSLFGGKTAFEVAKEGYAKHLSQQYTWFTAWLNGNNNEYTKMTDIEEYSPCEFGLYYTSVGDDVNKNDMFENISNRKPAAEKPEKKEDTDTKQDATNNKEERKNITIAIILMTTSALGLSFILTKNNKKK